METRVLMVTPNWRWDDAPLAVDTLRPPVCPPLEFAYLSSGLPSCQVGVVDAYVRNLTRDDLAAECAAFKPSVVVVATTPSLLYWRCPPFTLEAVKAAVLSLRNTSDARIILIGPHGTFSPSWTLDVTGADACFRGAFELRLPEAITSGNLLDHDNVAVPGRTASIAVETASRLPIASFEHIELRYPYEPHMWCITDGERANLGDLGGSALLEASRGCPWSCVYCAKAPVRDRFERRPVELVEAELNELADRGVGYVYFIDETFNLKGPGFDALLAGLAKSGLRFGFQGRSDLITDENAERLYEAGCVYAEIGIDTVDDELSGSIGRRQHLERSNLGVEAATKHIPITRFNRLNLSTVDYRLRFGLTADVDWDYPADPAYPYPGAPLGDLVMRLYGREDFDWPFAEQYSWWLRIEVKLQRSMPLLSDDIVIRLKDTFLDLDRDAAMVLTNLLEGIQSEPEFHEANKIIDGGGLGVRVRHTGTK